MSPKALLVVHGIGEQVQGETTEKLVRGLSAAYGDRLRVRRNEGGHAVGAEVSDVSVRFYEVYWADLLSRAANRGALTWSTRPSRGDSREVAAPHRCIRQGGESTLGSGVIGATR